MREILDNVVEQLKPKYDEITAYLTALTCVVLFVVYPEFRQTYFEILSGAGADRASIAFMALALIATIGLFLSFAHVFMKHKKSWFEKTCIGAFIMGTNSFAGIVAGIEMLPSRWSILIIIPIWNILMGIWLLYQLGLNKFTVSDQDTTWTEVLFASITLLIVFGVTDFGFHLSWAIAFSICVFYSSTVFYFVTWIFNYFRFRRLART
jgi:membrane-anchored glycerophosphoryl diester phosphodiesterase (GDPDase)